MKRLLLLLAVFSLLQFTKPPKEGISGQIFWVSGDQMPGPGKSVSAQQGIRREIWVYEWLTLNDVRLNNQFVKEIKREPVAQVWSAADGTFKIKLPPGQYSVFTREPEGLFANMIDQNNCVSCVVVKPRQFTWISIIVDYEAAY